MKNRGLVILVTGLMLAAATPAMAQWGGRAGEVLNEWMSTHPEFARELREDPSRLYNPGWRNEHPGLEEALESRPDMWNALVAQAPNFYDPRFREFLNNHPNIARELAAHPGYLFDRGFIDAHPALAEFLARNGRPWRVYRASLDYGDTWGDYDEN